MKKSLLLTLLLGLFSSPCFGITIQDICKRLLHIKKKKYTIWSKINLPYGRNIFHEAIKLNDYDIVKNYLDCNDHRLLFQEDHSNKFPIHYAEIDTGIYHLLLEAMYDYLEQKILSTEEQNNTKNT